MNYIKKKSIYSLGKKHEYLDNVALMVLEKWEITEIVTKKYERN